MSETRQHSITAGEASAVTRHQTGVVIPVYLPETVDASQGASLVRDTVACYCATVEDPSTVCVSVDGEPYGGELGRELAARWGVSLCVAENGGKLAASRRGVEVLLAKRALAYVAIVDQDGDHFANELVNLVRVAEHITRVRADGRVLVGGARVSRHRPMGFLRGELEGLADLVLLDALQYRAAMTGHPLRLEYAYAHDVCPDFHSGYKLFDRDTAHAVFLGPAERAGVSEACYSRHACEAVMSVEALEHGATLGVARRTTVNRQPVSTFAQYDVGELTADMIIWPCKRLGIPLPFVEQWIANHAQRLRLITLLPEGLAHVHRIRELVRAAYGAAGDDRADIHPIFV